MVPIVPNSLALIYRPLYHILNLLENGEFSLFDDHLKYLHARYTHARSILNISILVSKVYAKLLFFINMRWNNVLLLPFGMISILLN